MSRERYQITPAAVTTERLSRLGQSVRIICLPIQPMLPEQPRGILGPLPIRLNPNPLPLRAPRPVRLIAPVSAYNVLYSRRPLPLATQVRSHRLGAITRAS